MDRKQKVKRDAIISDEATAALCPLVAVCVYYHGSTTNGEGTKVVCGYSEQ